MRTTPPFRFQCVRFIAMGILQSRRATDTVVEPPSYCSLQHSHDKNDLICLILSNSLMQGTNISLTERSATAAPMSPTNSFIFTSIITSHIHNYSPNTNPLAHIVEMRNTDTTMYIQYNRTHTFLYHSNQATALSAMFGVSIQRFRRSARFSWPQWP